MGPTIPEGHDDVRAGEDLQHENPRRDEGDVFTELILEFQVNYIGIVY